MKVLVIAATLLAAPLFLEGPCPAAEARTLLFKLKTPDPIAHEADTLRLARALEAVPGVDSVELRATLGEVRVTWEPERVTVSGLVSAAERERFTAHSTYVATQE